MERLRILFGASVANWRDLLFSQLSNPAESNTLGLLTGRRIIRRENRTFVLRLIIAIALVAIAVQRFTPRAAEAQSTIYPFYIEPGSELLRAPDGSSQVYGKVVVDMRSGKIWGFPTLAPQSYPSNGLQNKRQTSVHSNWKVRV